MWSPVAARLAETYRITACDLPGHGALAGRPFTVEGAVRQVTSAVDEAVRATGRKPVVAGTSLGGLATLAYGAGRHGGAAGLFAHGATLRTDGPLLGPHRCAAQLMRWLGARRSQRVHSRLLRGSLPDESYRAVMSGGLSPHGFTQAMAAISRQDMLSVVSGITTPLILANGLGDPLFRVQERQFLHSARRSGAPVRLVHVPGPHLLSLTDPMVFARVLERACEELLSMAGSRG